jgi:hypothetical protein
MSVAEAAGVTRRGLPPSPVSERRKKRVPCLWRERLFGEPPEEPDRLPELVEVSAARLAVGEVRFKSSAIKRREPILEVLSDEFHELAAWHLGQVCGAHVVSVAAKYRSSA